MSRSAKFRKKSENGKLVRIVTKREFTRHREKKNRAENLTEDSRFSPQSPLRSGHFVLISHFFSPLHVHVSLLHHPLIDFFSHFLLFVSFFALLRHLLETVPSESQSHHRTYLSCVLQMCDTLSSNLLWFCFVLMYARFINFFLNVFHKHVFQHHVFHSCPVLSWMPMLWQTDRRHDS